MSEMANWGESTVILVGYVLGAQLMSGVATLFSIGVFVLPISNRVGKARSYWVAAMGGVISTLVVVRVPTYVTR